MSELQHDLGLSHGTIVRIIEQLGFHKVCADGFREHHLKTISRKEWLVLSHSAKCMPFMVMISSKALSLDTRRGFTVTLRRQNVQTWSGTTLGPRDLSKRKSAGRMMISVLRVRKGVLLDFMEKGTTLNAASYCETLERLRVTRQRQRPGLLTTGVLLLYDKVASAPHTVSDVTLIQLLQRFKWILLEHQPCRLDLAPSVYYTLPGGYHIA